MNENIRFAVVIGVVLAVVGAAFWFWYGNETTEVARGDGPVSAAPPAARAEPAPLEAAAAAEPAVAAPASDAPAVSRDPEARRPKAQRPSGIGSIRGEAVGKSNEGPAAGAEIVVELQEWDLSQELPAKEKTTWTVRTDGEGKFRITHLPITPDFSKVPARYAVMATKGDGFGMGSVALTDHEPDGFVRIELGEFGSIAGRVLTRDNQPVAEAFVFPDEGKQSRVDGTSMRALTDADGRFIVEHLPRTDWKLTVRAAGFAVTTTDFIAIDSNDTEIILSTGNQATGVVVMAHGGEPVADVRVVVRQDDQNRNTHAGTTDARGEFTVTELAAGSYSVSVDNDEMVVVGPPPRFDIGNEKDVANLKIPLAVGAVVSGRTYDVDTREALANVTIRAMGQGQTRDAISDGDGLFKLKGLAEGTHTLQRLRKPGYLYGEQREAKSVFVALGQELGGVDFPMKQGLSIRGVVVDEQGTPIDQVRVTSREMSGVGEGESTVTDARGTFEHRGFSPGAQVTLYAARAGFSANPVGPLTMGQEDTNDVRIEMEPGASIAGVVVDRRGKPMADMYVYARTQNGGQGGGGGATELDGRFKVDGLAAGAYTMLLRRNDGQYRGDTPTGEPITVGRGQALTGVRLVFEEAQGLTISGRVVNAKREPVSSAHVDAYILSGGQSYGYVRTDEAGSFEIAGLLEGEHRVSAYHPEHSRLVIESVAAGSRNLIIVLEDQATIEGHVLDARTGRPIVSFQAAGFLGDQGFQPHMSQGLTTFYDANGAFKLTRIEAGDVSVVARAEGYAPGVEVLTGVRSGETVTGVVLRLNAGAAVEGAVVDSRGVPISGARVYPGGVPSEPWMRERGVVGTTDSNGRFVITSLAPGPTQIGAHHAKYPPASVPVDLVAGRTTPVEIMLGEGGSIEGYVRIGGKPAVGQYVYAREAARVTGQRQNGRTDDSGYYSFSELAAGEYNVGTTVQTATGANRGANRSATVEVAMATQVDFEFAAGDANVEGVVTLDGRPVPSGNVTAQMIAGDAPEGISAQLAGDGSYRLEGLPAGTATLTVGARSGNGWINRGVLVELVSGQTVRRDIELNEGVRVTGTVSGHAEGDFVVVAALRGEVQITTISEQLIQELQDDVVGQAQVQNGVFELRGLEPGQYTFVAVDIGNVQGGGPDFENARFTTRVTNVSLDHATVDLSIP